MAQAFAVVARAGGRRTSEDNGDGRCHPMRGPNEYPTATQDVGGRTACLDLACAGGGTGNTHCDKVTHKLFRHRGNLRALGTQLHSCSANSRVEPTQTGSFETANNP
jgi:hypothetical protein